MKKKRIFMWITLFTILLTCKDVYAYDHNNYKHRSLCGTFEVAGFHRDGYIDTVACYNSFNDARNFMRNNGANDLVVMTKVNGETKVVDANEALVDLTEGPTQLTYYYLSDSLNSRRYTYMYNHGSYRGGDAGLLDVSYSSDSKIYMAKIELADFTGWVAQENYEIVPITWVKSASTYTVNNESIVHNLITRVQNDPSYYSLAIGPKPSMLPNGTYYSYDGHYFYNDLVKMIKDYRYSTRANSVNASNPYYNYYMYLSNHTRTSYSSVTIDEYVRNVLGYKENVYGHTASSGTSRLYGSGTFFYYAQEKYGVNALLSLSLSRNETGNGRSNLAVNKNNGFGLNAVDSNPIGGANSYGSFPSSILGYASKWATYGYLHPRDWRYFGPQFGNKWIGMNVQYASDAYWSENMANHYYNFDKTYGLQDYNYYQLGILKYPQAAYQSASYSSKKIYDYPEADDAVVIVGETTVNGETWYKLVSDLNVDSNYNEIGYPGDYNWNAYVYVPAKAIQKINNGKNGYISPNNVTEYQNKNYEYNLYVESGVLKPRVAITTKDTPYYYDSSLTSKTGVTLLKDRYVMVYSVATLNNQPVAYLVTSNYWHDQKEWVSADSIKFTNTTYGKITLTYSSNMYSWVNYNREDAEYSIISGLYTNTYFPVLEQSTVGSDVWLKVPVSLTSNDNVYGYTLKNYKNEIWVDLSTPVVENISPTITAVDKTLIEGDTFDPKKDVTATDPEDGDLTSQLEITSNVDTTKPGTYEVTYKVKDSSNLEATRTIKVTVKENKAPVINAEDIIITVNIPYNEKEGVTASDEEDGDLTSSIVVKENTVKINTVGTYKIVYEVTDKNNKKTTKEIKVDVVKDREPVINASNKNIIINTEFDPYQGVTATDPEDGNITKKIKITSNTVDTTKLGEYSITYQVTDTSSNTTTKTINIRVIDKQEAEGEFYLNELTWNESKKKYTFSGYLIILNQNNTTNKTYQLILKNKNDKKEYSIYMDKWTSSVPFDLGSENGKDYSNSWFKGEISLSDIPNGDYSLYMKTIDSEYFTEKEVTNIFNKTISRRAKENNKAYEFEVMLNLKSRIIELKVRNELYTLNVAPTFRNMINDYDDIDFKDNKLYVKGTSYNYDAVYNDKSQIVRKLIIENTSTYEQYVYDVGATNKGSYVVTSKDNKSKEYAWYEASIDVSNIPKGNYSLMIYTKTKDAEDFGEIKDMFGNINKAEATISNKNYKIELNKERQNRIELVIS